MVQLLSIVVFLLGLSSPTTAFGEDVSEMMGQAANALEAEAQNSQNRANAIAPVAFQMALSQDPAQRRSAEILFEEMARQERAANLNHEAAQANFDHYRALKQDINGLMLTGRGQAIQLTEGEKEQLSAQGIEVREIERLISLSDWEGVRRLLDVGESAELSLDDEERAIGFARQTLTQYPISNERPLQDPHSLPTPQSIQMASLGEVPAINVPKVSAVAVPILAPEHELRAMGIRRPVPGLNILELGHRQVQRAFRNAP